MAGPQGPKSGPLDPNSGLGAREPVSELVFSTISHLERTQKGTPERRKFNKEQAAKQREKRRRVSILSSITALKFSRVFKLI